MAIVASVVSALLVKHHDNQVKAEKAAEAAIVRNFGTQLDNALTPVGQGASLSIEDAVQLARCLRDRPTADRAFAALEQARRPRVERIIKQAARINNNKAATGAARVVRDMMLPLILKLIANSKQEKQLYGYHIDWGTPA